MKNANKDRRFQFRMTDADFKKLEEQSRKTGLPKSVIILSAWKKLKVVEQPSVDFVKCSAELRHIGNNLNQIARSVNSVGKADADKLRKALDDLLALDSAMWKFYGGGAK